MILKIRPGRFRFTSILATTRDGWQRYDSLDEMPPLMRARCLKALESRNSGTVLIAGRNRPDEPEPALPAPPALPSSGVSQFRLMGLAAVAFHLLTAGLALAWLLLARR